MHLVASAHPSACLLSYEYTHALHLSHNIMSVTALLIQTMFSLSNFLPYCVHCNLNVRRGADRYLYNQNFKIKDTFSKMFVLF